MDDDADEIVGEVRFRVTEAEFIAAHRAARIARSPSYDSWWWRITLVGIGHFLFLVGALFLVLQVRGGAISWGLVCLSLFWAAAGCWLADAWLYGYRRRYRKLHRAHPLAGLDVEKTFTPDHILTHAANMDDAADWPVFARVVELRDGFVLEVRPLNTAWIPKHALRPPLDADALAAFLRSKVGNHKVIDRRARLRKEDRPDGRRR